MREEISNRLLEFAARIIEMGKELNRTFEGRHVYGQLFRAATSAGANYEESHSGESTRDFIHKREVALKELRESLYWNKLIERTGMISNKDLIVFLLTENNELIKILAKSLTTIKNNTSHKKR